MSRTADVSIVSDVRETARQELVYDVDAYRQMFEQEFTYLNGFLRNVRRYAARPALTCPLRGTTWNYAELNAMCNRVANALLAAGVTKNDVVVYQLYNCAEFVFLYLALKKIGAIGCTINFRLAYGETAFILDDSKPVVYFYDSQIKEMADKAMAMARHKPRLAVMVNAWVDEEPPAGPLTFDQFVEGHEAIDPGVEDPGGLYDETLRLYTSGTTGMPKGIPLNNANEVLTAHDIIMNFFMTCFDKTMNMSPWFHRGGIHTGGPTPTLFVGGEVVALRLFHPRTTLDYVEKYGLTFLIGAPPMLKLLHDLQVKKPRDLSKLRGIVTNGAPLELKACLDYQRVLNPRIFNGYGTSETYVNTFLRPHDLPHMAGTAGNASTDDLVSVVKVHPDRRSEPDELAAKDNVEMGEIIIKAPHKGTYMYINNPKETQKVFYKGWMYTGDMGIWDANEYITVVGRKDDMILSAGENIHPVQIEEVLNEHPKVKESVVVGVPDEVRGQSVVAYLIREDDSVSAKDLDEHCRKHPMLAMYKRPRYYRFVEELPYTATGKKIHYKVKAMAVEDFEKGLLEKA